MTATVSDRVRKLRKLPTIRAQCSKVFELAKKNQLKYFEYHAQAEDGMIDYCVDIIKKDYPDYGSIPPHGRWRHLDAGRERIAPMMRKWKESPTPPDDSEVCRRVIDLFLVSVLLDAGAGSKWKYKEPGTETSYDRSEGLGVASFHMFDNGLFSSDQSQPHRVDAKKLRDLKPEKVGELMQHSEANPMAGLEGRAELLQKLAGALKGHKDYFGEDGRPGNIIDYLKAKSEKVDGIREVPVAILWEVLIYGLEDIWPKSRTQLDGVYLGDVWPCDTLPPDNVENGIGNYVPFHKLTGWICYSLIEPLEKILHWRISGVENMTGLPEYRNGGLLIDTGVLSLKRKAFSDEDFPNKDSPIPRLQPHHPAIIEWRALTIIGLDRAHEGINKRLGTSLTLAQVLESATWKGGRLKAKELRPGMIPPIEIISDGTLF